MAQSPATSRFASAAERLSGAQARAMERRRFRRIPVIVGGRMLDPLGREHDCRTADISPGDVRIAAPLVIPPGQRIVMYLEGFGRLSGHVARQCGETEFAVIFDTSTHKREKLAETLTWIANKDSLGLEDVQPSAAAIAARAGTQLAQLVLENGETIEGEILDLSLAGITVKSASTPPLGAWVRFGGVYGRIARKTECGFAVDFETRAQKTPGG